MNWNLSNGATESAMIWDRRAETWNKARLDEKTRKSDDRMVETVDYLEKKGLLLPKYDVADIGCGMGELSVAFAKRVHHVVGFDISEKMIQYSKEYAASEKQKNITLHTCDFQDLDIEKEDLKEKLDLVFRSLTPAIQDQKSLEKSIAMSKGYCCNITHVSHNSQLEKRIAKELFNKEPLQRWNGEWFHFLISTLKKMDYFPEISYYNRHQERKIYFDEEYLDLLTERLLDSKEQNKRNKNQIRSWFQNNVTDDGFILDITDTCYGRTLWSIKK